MSNSDQTLRTWWLGPICLFIATVAVGCVSSGKYNELEAQQAELVAERDALVTETELMSSELASVKAENEEMQDTYGQLVRELQAEVEDGQITIHKLVDGIRLGVSDELLFPSGGTTLNANGTALIKRVAEQVSGDGSAIFVEGHTDDVQVGKTLKARYPTNWELAGARAALVVRVLSENGVEPQRLRAVSHGPFAPVAPNDSKENRARNRRTEIILRAMP